LALPPPPELPPQPQLQPEQQPVQLEPRAQLALPLELLELQVLR
jgi:hypothetical protein